MRALKASALEILSTPAQEPSVACLPMSTCLRKIMSVASRAATLPRLTLRVFLTMSTNQSITEGLPPLRADLVSLPERAATADLLDILPPQLARRYATPDGGILREPCDRPKAVHVTLLPRGTDPLEYLALVRRLNAVGMLSFTKEPKVVNGVFVVPKGDGLRLIVNAIPSNTNFVDPPAVQLPTPDVLATLQADPSKPLYIGKMDLDNFYHRLRLPEWMWPYFALPPVRACDVGLRVTIWSILVASHCLWVGRTQLG